MPNRKRNRSITIRMTDNEYDKFTAAYQKCADKFKSQSEFIMSFLGKKPIVIIDDFKDVLVELKRQGNNLNQLTRYVHDSYAFDENVISYLENCNMAYLKIIKLCDDIPEKIHRLEDDNAAAYG